MKLGKPIAAALSLMCLSGASVTQQTYAEGQVWEYRTRPGDEGSLLRIQRIEDVEAFAEDGPVYHISIVGVRFVGLPITGPVGHAPVSRHSLDASVTRLSSSDVVFPDPESGIAEWRNANGGVFTIPVAEIVDLIAKAVSSASQSSE